MKEILLARPSLFIVNDMKNLLISLNYTTKPIKVLNTIQSIDMQSIGGTVISTAINSDVQEDYEQVTKFIKDLDASMPIMIATLVELNSLRKSLDLKFKNVGLEMNFYSIQETAQRNRFLNPYNDVLVIHRNDIANKVSFSTTKRIVGSFFR